MLWSVWVGTESRPLLVPNLLVVLVVEAEGRVESDDDCPDPCGGESRRRTGSARLGLIVNMILMFPPQFERMTPFQSPAMPEYVHSVRPYSNLVAPTVCLLCGGLACLPQPHPSISTANQVVSHTFGLAHSPCSASSRKEPPPYADPCSIFPTLGARNDTYSTTWDWEPSQEQVIELGGAMLPLLQASASLQAPNMTSPEPRP